MSYHTIIFAPDTLSDEGPMVEVRGEGVGSVGTQTTLPILAREVIIYGSRGEELFFANPTPTKRIVGFRNE